MLYCLLIWPWLYCFTFILHLWCLWVVTSPPLRIWQLTLCLIMMYVKVLKLHFRALDVKQSVRGFLITSAATSELPGASILLLFSENIFLMVDLLKVTKRTLKYWKLYICRPFIDNMTPLGFCVTLACSGRWPSALEEEWVLSFTPCTASVKHVLSTVGVNPNQGNVLHVQFS